MGTTTPHGRIGPPTMIGTTALGRIHLRIEKPDGPEPMLLERRWSTPERAQHWCEGVVADPGPDVVVEEAHVLVERWRHAKSWEAGNHRSETEGVQVGVPDGEGSITWGAPHGGTSS
ncbi:MAG: hypothetical protein M3130_06655 [Actinomycetota bacterium]|nr:hypothetical protein [Actinomycetota bacterium]